MNELFEKFCSFENLYIAYRNNNNPDNRNNNIGFRVCVSHLLKL